MIGLSLSGCLKDLVEDKVLIDDVEMIISSADGNRVDEVIQNYFKVEWAEYKPFKRVLLLEIFHYLRQNNKIVYPRIKGMPIPKLTNGKIWVNDESEIEWESNYDDPKPKELVIVYRGQHYCLFNSIYGSTTIDLNKAARYTKSQAKEVMRVIKKQYLNDPATFKLYSVMSIKDLEPLTLKVVESIDLINLFEREENEPHHKFNQ